MSELTRNQRMPDVIAPSLDTRTIDITWLDGHESAYDFEFLRWKCPCAICRGEGGTPGILSTTKSLSPDQTALIDAGPVGNYAMSVTWRDGHATGIYSWDYLRRICPCDVCAGIRRGQSSATSP